MKTALLMLLLLGGIITGAYAQRGWGHRSHHDRYADNYRGRGHYRDYDRRDYRRYRDRNCYPDRRVVYVRPYPVVMYPPPPPPPPRPFRRPRVIITL